LGRQAVAVHRESDKPWPAADRGFGVAACTPIPHTVLRLSTSLLAGASLALILAGCRGSGNGQARDELIVLDRSIGGVALREERADVERRLGRGFVLKADDQKQPPVHGEDVLYTKHALEVWYVSRNATNASRERGRVIAVLTRSPRYQTPEGVHVGSPASALHAIKA
jgi:hypothetical protein